MRQLVGALVAGIVLTTAALGQATPVAAGAEHSVRRAAACQKLLAAALGDGPIAPSDAFWADQDSDRVLTRPELHRAIHTEITAQVRGRFVKLDRNRDGRVAQVEVPTMSPKRFARFDMNSDGAFTANELSRVMGLQVASRVDQLFARLDADGDGRWTELELIDRTGERVAANAPPAQ